MTLAYNIKGKAFLRVKDSKDVILKSDYNIVQPFTQMVEADKYDEAMNRLYETLYDKFIKIFPKLNTLLIDIEGYEVRK